MFAVMALLLGVGLAAIIAHAHFTQRSIKQSTQSSTQQANATGSKTAGTTHIPEIAQAQPSTSAKMICATEAQYDISQAIGVLATNVSTPSWDEATHVYACDYLYTAGAKITLSVKEMSSVSETTAYFNSLGQKLGHSQELTIGEGAYSTTTGSVVVRKDYKVLLIDVSQLPENFGSQTNTRGAIAISIANTILGCWSGA